MPDVILSFLRTRWLLLLVLLVFITFKIPHLHYPFFIDEGWVYAPAVKTMAINGPSLLPGAIPAEYSRGHPLMFHFLCAAWIRLFGASNTAIHTFPLLLSVIFLIVLYEGCLRLFGKKEAILILLLVATRVVFFVQSSFVYMEVMVALFAFASLYGYSKGRHVLTAIMLFMLFFTKEGGAIFGAVLGIDAFIALFKKSESKATRWERFFSVLVPSCLIALFYVLQKVRLGWYVLPEHTNLIKPDWNSYYLMFRSALYWAFRGDSAMNVLVLCVTLACLIPAIRFRNIRYLFLILPAFVVYSQAEIFPKNTYDSAAWICLFLLFFSIPVYYLLRLNSNLTAPARKFVALLGISVIVFVLYSALTQIAYRYLLVVVVFVLIFLALCITMAIATAGSKAFYGAVAGVLLIGAYGFYSNESTQDTQLGAFSLMNVQLKELAFLEKENAYDKVIAHGCAWEMIRFTDTLQGFVDSRRVFKRMVRFPLDSTAEYAMFGNSCGEQEEYKHMLANPRFHSVYKVRDGEVWAEIFKRN